MQCNFLKVTNKEDGIVRIRPILVYRCLVPESQIYVPTGEVLKKYCYSEHFLNCPRLKVYDKFKTK
jgi:hypothetical protein